MNEVPFIDIMNPFSSTRQYSTYIHTYLMVFRAPYRNHGAAGSSPAEGLMSYFRNCSPLDHHLKIYLLPFYPSIFPSARQSVSPPVNPSVHQLFNSHLFLFYVVQMVPLFSLLEPLSVSHKHFLLSFSKTGMVK